MLAGKEVYGKVGLWLMVEIRSRGRQVEREIERERACLSQRSEMEE